jgi:hypothetical protein
VPSKTGICRSDEGVTIAEVAIVIAVLVIAWGTIGSSRFQPAKDETCLHPQIACTPAHARLVTGNGAAQVVERDRFVDALVRAHRRDQKPAVRRTVAQLDGSEGRTTTSPLTGSPGSTDR